jgi:arylsulfatase A-like enzyme
MRSFSRPAALTAALTLFAVPGPSACGGGAGKDYNVLLVTLDTTRADYLGCYAGLARDPSHPLARTPALDALAAEGVRFDMGLSTAAVTPVSHAAILTGLCNHHHGVRVMFAQGGFRLPETTPTLFTVLHEKGWRTGAFHSAFPVSDFFGLGRGFDVYETMKGEMQGGPDAANWDIHKLQRRSDATTDLALAFLEHTDRPFAMWIHYWDPHDTVLLPPDVTLPQGTLTPEQELAARRRLYATEIGFVDSQFQRVVDALKARGEWERTIVVVVGDHGEGLDDHGWLYHRILYQEEIRVPFLVRVPGTEGGDDGRVVTSLVSTVDLAPTVYDYLGLEGPPADGRSLRPLIEGRPDEPRIALADQVNDLDFNAGDILRAKRPQDLYVYCATDGRWKLLYRPQDPGASELFDLEHDPLERANLFAPDHPEAVRLKTELAERRPWVTAPFVPIKVSEAQTAGVQKTLKGLGYTGGEAGDQAWSWVCPEHYRQDTGGKKCPLCHRPPVPVAAR